MEKVERLEKEVLVLLFCFIENEKLFGGNLDKEIAAAVSIFHPVAQAILMHCFTSDSCGQGRQKYLTTTHIIKRQLLLHFNLGSDGCFQ